jgi:hypothetical protein
VDRGTYCASRSADAGRVTRPIGKTGRWSSTLTEVWSALTQNVSGYIWLGDAANQNAPVLLVDAGCLVFPSMMPRLVVLPDMDELYVCTSRDMSFIRDNDYDGNAIRHAPEDQLQSRFLRRSNHIPESAFAAPNLNLRRPATAIRSLKGTRITFRITGSPFVGAQSVLFSGRYLSHRSIA